MSVIIEINTGKIKGYSKNGLKIFKGIPYAAPPIGELRFSHPIPVEPWNDVLDATQFGPFALQGYSGLEQLFGIPQNQSESDCLTLNVWTPSTDEKKRPVMVWIHGGGFITGGAALPIYEGESLVNRGNVVIVTINYRLGAFGYLYMPGITANVGMLDQLTALKWVKENINSFGGDPNNITIFGESAGGMSVIVLLAMPTAKGLFQHAIAQSGPITFEPSVGEKYSKRFMSELGLKPDDIGALRKIPAKNILKVQNKITARTKLTELLPFSPRIDGNILPRDPVDAARAGLAKDVDLIVGSNLNELKFFSAFDPRSSKTDEDVLYKIIGKILKYLGQEENRAKQLIATYKEAREGFYSTAPQDIIDAITTDFLFRIPATRLAEAQSMHQPNTYNYLFTWKSPAFKGKLGSCHALEVPFVFNTYKGKPIDEFCGKGTKADALSEKMMNAWLAFARTGNPNHGGIPKWPSYNAEKRSTMLMGEKFEVVDAAFEKERKAWDGII